MCDLADGFKLCTCDDETLTDPDWVLERRFRHLKPQTRRGRVLMPRYTQKEKQQRKRIIDELNAGNCFDFDYTPAEHDVLTLKASGRIHRFRIENGRWTLDKSNALTGWRAQMCQINNGKVG